ncbi:MULTISPECIES: hypothetical protein [Nostoc]|uniref:Uncharacterized protein n=1 Tax=Nostoc paludosum FACHB-159 TaxID=2692908 RepID=A0ABR8K6Q0_9NOSO|nr:MULTISPECIES: hypothetical protein [Nostoc]MBD2678186.1 hypothetical protein [Nostoc sp. FACHB-857]MBD2734446.1 hypothetical protein [Nostoc paludosum FACHB-159]
MAYFEDNASNSVEINGISFETLVSKQVLTVPKKKCIGKLRYILQLLSLSGGEIFPIDSVQMGIRITNNTDKTLRFQLASDLLYPEIVGEDDEILVEGGWFSYTQSEEYTYPSLIPKANVTFFIEAQTFWIWGNRLGILIPTSFYGGWILKPLKLGVYQFRFTYYKSQTEVKIDELSSQDTQQLEEIWTGEAKTPFIELRIVQN